MPWPPGFTLAGLLFGGFGAFCVRQLLQMAWLQRHGRRVGGRVVEVTQYEHGGPKSKETSWSTTVEYFVGESRFRIDLPLNGTPDYQVGATLPVYYKPESPHRGVVICRREYLKWGLLLLACSGVLVGLSYASSR